jgi:hypothetical protein
MSISQNYINQSPSLLLNFDRTNQLDPRANITRTSTGTYIDAEGTVRTAGPNEPRFNFENGECKGLLVESSRTNIIISSQVFNIGGWTQDGILLTANETTAPDGTTTATLISQGTGNNRTYHFDNSGVIGYKIFSIFAKSGSGNTFQISFVNTDVGTVTFNTSDGTMSGVSSNRKSSVVDPYSIKLVNGWYRFVVPVYIFFPSGNSSYFSISGPSSSVYIWGMQVESGNVPSSYIPTTSTTVTRAADKVTINDLSWFDDNEGTFVVDTVLTENQRLGFSTTTTLFSVDNGTSQICLDTVKVNVGTGDTLYNLVGEKNIVGYSSARNIIATDGGLPILVGIASTSYISNASTTTGSISGMNRLALGWDPFNSNANLNGTIKSFRYYPSLLDDNQIESLVKKDLEIPSPTLVTNSMVNKVYVTGITTITNGDVNGFYQFKGTMNTFGCGNPSSAVFIELKDDINWSKMICQFEMTGGASCWSFNGGGSSTGSTGGPEVNPSTPGFIPGGNMEPYNEDLGDRIFKDINAYSSNPVFKRQLSACDGSANNAFRNLDNPNVQSFWTYCRRKNKSSGLAGPFHSRSCTGIGYYILIKNIYIF